MTESSFFAIKNLEFKNGLLTRLILGVYELLINLNTRGFEMKFCIFGIWIVLISIVKCQTNQNSGCYDLLTRVTVEVSLYIRSIICDDNLSATLVIDSLQGFWFGNIDGLCTNSLENIGHIDMDYLVRHPSLALNLLKNGQSLDNAVTRVSIDEPNSGTHYITVFGQDRTRFVLTIKRKCYYIAGPNVVSTSTTSLTTSAAEITPPLSSHPTTPSTLESDTSANVQPTTSEINNSDECSIFTTNGYVVFKCNKTKPNVRETITTTQSLMTSTQGSLEIAKIEWMESKRIEFERKRESLMRFSSADEDNSESDTIDFTKWINFSEVVKPSDMFGASLVDNKNDYHLTLWNSNDYSDSLSLFPTETLRNTDYTVPIIGDSMVTFATIIPSVLMRKNGHTLSPAVTNIVPNYQSSLLSNVIGDKITNVIQNINMFASDPKFSASFMSPDRPDTYSSISEKIQSSIFYSDVFPSNPANPNINMLSTSRPTLSSLEEIKHSAILFSKSPLLISEDFDRATKGQVNPTTRSKSLSTTKAFAEFESMTILHPSEGIVFTSLNMESSLSLYYSTSITDSNAETPIHPSSTSSLDSSDYFSTLDSSSTLPLSSKINEISSSFDTDKLMSTDTKISPHPASTKFGHSTVYEIKDLEMDNSTVPQKQPDGDLDEETFWPVVAALVVGIPSVVVFGIAIVVIHRRRLAKPSQTTTTISSLNSEL